ncbi:mechanosensitive ion channel [Vibrio europaeus]|uniref:Small-conductance mechanosensitive channel n=1 Tax=Vibrio europaeus TaxID=300876 RepID=A0A178JEB6_9VIBR|nr:mechanosensitive ion channel domain-containing protein [Vibrio europaeus]MDC5703687.1 mechanosensitive ion channel [Vibrio europaeus]MDC5708359.1 mechanosensitive ion channel [Vibrio europaeus]MDC5714234.1 mechanosensitive ion channel [Vibrio europaeus]MDC5722449.1 mechanosensitive ion channel [Vibrio europaeus]MDC5727270.1 mechanosensitive ion channel [Vibrio europaeus]
MDLMSLKKLRALVVGLVISFGFLFGASAYAAQEGEQLSKQEREVEKITNEFIELVDSIETATGGAKDALQLKLFQKNESLRTALESAVNSSSIPDDKLISYIRMQQTYVSGASEYLEEKIKAVNNKIDSAKSEDKLTMLNDYQELQHYFDIVMESAWENIEWLNELGQDESIAQAQFKDSLNKRLRLMSASVEYFNQQISVVGRQLAVSPESELASLQLGQLIIQQRMNITVDSLSSLISIADQVGLDTAEYKRLIFEVTGSITQDLLEGRVILSIISHWSDKLWDWVANNAPQHVFHLFIFALIIFSTSLLAKLVRKITSKTVVSKNLKLSQLMQDFFIGMSGNVVWVIGILVGLSQIGLNLAPVLTGFGIAGVIIGFALQDTLSNFAAGMMLLIYKPFDVGDFVFAGGVDGKVSHMSLVNTTIKTFDNQIIIIPNGKIWGDVIKNVTHERVRRVDMVFSIGYSDDLLKAESILTEIVTTHPAVLRTPEPNIRVHTLNTSSVDFIVRPWVKTDDYWDVYWDVTKEVKLRFDREGISIPFPQQDVHLHMVKESSEQ